MSDEQPWRIDWVESIPLEKIDPDPNPLRKTLSQQHIDDILNSFSLFRTGPLDALLVKPMENDRYRIISGNHRYHALKQGGFKETQCHIIEPLSDAEEFLMKLHANTHRKNLSDLEHCEAMSFEKDLYEAFYPDTRQSKNRLTERVLPHENFVRTVNLSHDSETTHPNDSESDNSDHVERGHEQNSLTEKVLPHEQNFRAVNLSHDSKANDPNDSGSDHSDHVERGHEQNSLTERVSSNGHFVRTVNPSYARLKAKELGVTPTSIRRDIRVGEIIREIPQLKASEATKNDIYSLTKCSPAERRHLQDMLKIPGNQNDAMLKILDQALEQIQSRLNSKKRRTDKKNPGMRNPDKQHVDTQNPNAQQNSGMQNPQGGDCIRPESANSRNFSEHPDNLDFNMKNPVENPEMCIRIVYHQLRLGIFWRNAQQTSLKAMVQTDLLLKTAHLLQEEHRRLKERILHT